VREKKGKRVTKEKREERGNERMREKENY